MSLYAGVCNLRDRWHGAAIEVTPDGVSLKKAETLSPTEYIEFACPDYARMERDVGFSHALPWVVKPETIVRNLFDDLRHREIGLPLDEFLLDLDDPKFQGVAHPYGLSAITRLALTGFFDRGPGCQAVSMDERPGFDAAHPALRPSNSRAGSCALEVPLAVALNEIVFGDFTINPAMTTNLAVISPAVSQLELTAIRLTRTAINSLLLQVMGYANGPQDHLVEFISEHAEEWKFGAGTPVLCVGEETHGMVPHLSRSGGLDVRPESEQAAAAGVALYGALCDHKDLKLNSGSLREIDCELIAPFAIGVCEIAKSSPDGNSPDDLSGGNGDARTVLWCPLIEAGEKLGKENISLEWTGAAHELIIAENTGDSRIPGQWSYDRLADLRWYSQPRFVESEQSMPGRVQILIRNSAGCLDYGWSDPFTQVS